MMILCFACAFALGVCVCVAFYIFVIWPCIKDNDKQFIDMLNQNSWLEDRFEKECKISKYYVDKYIQLQEDYEKLKESNKNE